MKKKIFFWGSLCLILIGIFFYRVFNSDRDNSINDELGGYEEIRIMFGDEAKGYALGVDNPIYGKMGEKLIWNSTNDELNLSFTNASGDAEFLLKFFWNYEEVEFSVDGSEASTSYIFDSEYAEDNNWSITFSNDIDLTSDGFIGYLTSVVFINPNVYQKNTEFYEHKDYGITTTMYVFSDDNFDSYNPYNIFNFEDFQSYNDYGDEFYGLNVTDDPDLLNNPASFVTAEKGGKIALNFILGDSTGEKTEDFLLFAMLGNEQATINGEKTLPIYLPINSETNEPEAQYGELIIDVPNEEGQYEFIAFSVPMDQKLQILPIIENSFRITIIVE